MASAVTTGPRSRIPRASSREKRPGPPSASAASAARITTGPQPDLLEHLAGSFGPAATEPAGELLHPVAEEVAAERRPQHQLADSHGASSAQLHERETGYAPSMLRELLESR